MLKKSTFTPFVHGEIKPDGWLKRQLRIQADGLCGHLDKVWPDIRDSRWIGGGRDGWERVPYWLDGFIPLACLLDDEALTARAKRYIDGILAQQAQDGWICPCKPEERGAYDIWAYMLILKVLVMYADLHGDMRVEPAVSRALACMEKHLRRHTLFNWGAMRWYECLIPIYWLYERTGECWVLDLAYRLRAQGFDYTKLFSPYLDREPKRQWAYDTHVVNLAMCLKQEALLSRLTGCDVDAFALEAHAILMKYHGMAVGHFSGDECVAGTSPVRGTELCGVVEAMYSYEHLLALGGNPHWADALERLAYNALPAAISPDMWSHQYDQMTNQMRAERLPEDHVVFGTNAGDAHQFGLEPHFGCCTANFGQGWPKFASSAFMRSDTGLVSCLLAPAHVSFVVDGVKVMCRLETEYPFKGHARYAITTEAPVTFTLDIRVPSCAKCAAIDGEPRQPGRFHTIARTWAGTQFVLLEMTFDCVLEERPNDMRCLRRGPLLYAVAIDEQWQRQEYIRDGVERKYPYCDYAITPMSPWGYGFAGTSFRVLEADVAEIPFDTGAPPVTIMAALAPLDWPQMHGVCLPQPNSRQPMGDARPVRMIPYGCTNLRMTEMPVVET